MWVLAAEAAIHVYNRTPHKGLKYKTPLSVLNPEKKNHIESLQRFGCIAYVNIMNAESKFSKRSMKSILVGHTSTGYLLWYPLTKRFINSRHVDFNEKLVHGDIREK